MRFHPSTLSDALVVHDDENAALLGAIAKFNFLGWLDSRRWWLPIKIVCVVQVPSPHLANKILCLWVGEVVAFIDLLRVRLALFVALIELLRFAANPS